MFAVALVGVIVLIGLAVVIGRIEGSSADQAFRTIARRRRDLWEQEAALRNYEIALQDREHVLRGREAAIDRLERRLGDRPDGSDRVDPDPLGPDGRR